MTEIPSLVSQTRPLWVKLVSLAWPVLVQQFLILFVGLFDQGLVGGHAPLNSENNPALQSKHIAQQAALSNAIYLVWFLSSLSSLAAVGATALVARFIGAGEPRQAERVTNQTILLAVLIGVVSTPIALWGLPHLLGLLGLSEDAFSAAEQFLQPIILVLTAELVMVAGIACLVGAGDTKTGTIIRCGIALINIPLAWSFMNGLGPIPAFDFVGVAYGTSLSTTLGSLAVLVILIRGRYGLKLRRRDLRPDLVLLTRLLRISIPASFDTLSNCICQMWFLSLVNALGQVAITAHGNALRIEAMGFLSGQAFATAAGTLVGQFLGARRPDMARKAAWVGFSFGVSFMSFMGVIFYTFAPNLMSLFNPYDHQIQVVQTGVPVLRLVAFAMPPLAGIIVFTGVLRGAGDTRYPILVTWIGYLGFRIPLAYYLTRESLSFGEWGTISGANLGLIGAWLAMFADLFVRGTLFFIRFLKGKWALVKV